uniref:Flavin-containing monooxygenase n=1 Tax=Alexandrium monilatum TaxID=311494 RepID=A0A7S4PXJ1_9DINO
MASARVAIIGGGPSGLAACKAALEEGLAPTLFEKAAGVGGLWRGDEHGKVWKALRTNLSKYTCAFSDGPWPPSAPDFPAGSEVQGYLEGYAARHGLLRCARFRSEVTALQRLPDGAGWHVTWSEQGGSCSEAFGGVVVASGIFARPHCPELQGAEEFRGRVTHACEYREPTPFAGRRVLVVGAAFSGADIAADLAGAAASVTIACRRPLWYLPRYINSRPADLVFYSRAASARTRGASEEDRNLQRQRFFAGLVGQLPEPLAAPDPERGELPFVTITDSFLDSLRAGTVRARVAGVEHFRGSSVVFSDGTSEDFDDVILATGYRLELPFLPPEARDALELRPEDGLQPAILHEAVWPRGLAGLAFVGLYRGPYFAAMELQARWVCGVFSGRLPAPAPEELAAGLEVERQIREQRPRPQFPHGDYVGMVEALAQRVGVHPGEILGEEAHPLRPLLVDGPLLPFHFRLSGFGAQPEAAEAAIRECAAKFPLQPKP